MFKKFRNLVYLQLTQGVSPHDLALTAALGISIGIIPLFGITTLIFILAAYVLRLNQPLLQIINYAMTPIHVIMIPVFLRIGERMVDADPVSFSIKRMFRDFHGSYGVFFHKYGMAIAYAVLAWIVIAPVLGLIVYLILKPIFVRILRASEPTL